jgi:low affinity Fe/Cu permease
MDIVNMILSYWWLLVQIAIGIMALTIVTLVSAATARIISTDHKMLVDKHDHLLRNYRSVVGNLNAHKRRLREVRGSLATAYAYDRCSDETVKAFSAWLALGSPGANPGDESKWHTGGFVGGNAPPSIVNNDYVVAEDRFGYHPNVAFFPSTANVVITQALADQITEANITRKLEDSIQRGEDMAMHDVDNDHDGGAMLHADFRDETKEERVDRVRQQITESLSGEGRLSQWFGLTRAAWVTLPRSFMQEMPDEWQRRFAICLEEIQDTFPNAPKEIANTVVTGRVGGKFVRIPEWVSNYRRPDLDLINACRRADVVFADDGNSYSTPEHNGDGSVYIPDSDDPDAVDWMRQRVRHD